MSSFFTTPASQRKRKRPDAPSTAPRKRNPPPPSRPRHREDSITESDSDDADRHGSLDDDNNAVGESDTSSSDEDETAAEKRLRLAQRYLDNIRGEVEDEVGFDDAQIDRDLIAERLKEDVAETKGKIYRAIADQLDFARAPHVFGKSGLPKAITGCAVRLPYVWTVSKDLVVEKWELADPTTASLSNSPPSNVSPRRVPKKLVWRKGDKNKKGDRDYLGHTGEIVSIAVSDSGNYLATGDKHARLIIWDAHTLTPRKLFTRHRDAVLSLSFRRGTDQLFSGGADRAVIVWSAPESAYIETLVGHQDAVIGIAGGVEANQETCVSVGARDRTARLWKVVEENQLVFHGGGTARQKGLEKLRKGRFGKDVSYLDDQHDQQPNADNDDDDDDDDTPIAYTEGSIDCVALLDASLFVTASDSGALSLWSVQRKKPLFSYPLTHGRDPALPADQMSANADAATSAKKGPRLPRYVTALATVPYADLILTASWDGWIRAWRVGADKRTIEPVGRIGQIPPEQGPDGVLIRGIVNGLAVQERGDRGKDGLCVVAAVGKEPRLARWMAGQGRNGIYVFEVPRKALDGHVDDDEAE